MNSTIYVGLMKILQHKREEYLKDRYRVEGGKMEGKKKDIKRECREQRWWGENVSHFL